MKKFTENFIYAGPDAELFVCIIMFNSHNNPTTIDITISIVCK